MTDYVLQPPHSPSPRISTFKRLASIERDQVPAKRARSTKHHELPVELSLSSPITPTPPSFSRSPLSTISSVVPPSSPIKPSQMQMVLPPQAQPHYLRAHDPAQLKPPNTKKYKLPNSERLQLLAKLIEIINDIEFCVGCMARGYPVVSLHQLDNCPHGITDYKDNEWLRWRKTLIFPKSVGICGGCGVSNLVRVFCFISPHIFMVVIQGVHSENNNEDTKLLHCDQMGPKLCPHLDGIRVLAW